MDIKNKDVLNNSRNTFISVVIPVFNEAENLPVLTERLSHILIQYSKYEIIFINDGSVDNSAMIIEDLCKQNKSIKLVNLSRNYGHQAAISAGIIYAKGDAVIVMDADLQDPPEVIPQFIEKWQEGYDVVYAIRRNRKENILKRLSYYVFYRLLNRISDINIPFDSGDFSIMDKNIVNLINSFPERNRFIRGIRAWLGFRHVGLEYDRNERYSGKPKYTIKKLIKLASDGIYTFSYKPLLIASRMGIVITLSAFLGILIVLYLKLFTNSYIPGFAGITIIMLFLGGIQLVVLGIMGEYIGRIYDEVKGRPYYIIQSTTNIEQQEEKKYKKI